MLHLMFFVIGTVIGSFLNVLADRLPQEETIMGRSHCDHCQKKLEGVDLIPVISFIYLGGKCRRCKKKLSFFYPLVEVVTGLSFVWVLIYALSQLGNPALTGFANPGNLLEVLSLVRANLFYILALLGIVACSIVIFFADLKYQIIPDSIQVALFGFAFLFLATQGLTPQIFLNHVLAAIVTMLPILILFLATKGNGMGFGDVKLAFTMGFLLGMIGGLASVYIGFVSGATIGIILIALKRMKLRSKIAFGPFLIIGLLSALFFNNQIDQIVRTFYSY